MRIAISGTETDDDGVLPFRRERVPVPGALLVWSAGAPRYTPIPLTSKPLQVGRDASCDVALVDDRAASRRHGELAFDEAAGEIVVRDAASHNGTWIEGGKVSGERRLAATRPVILRVGGSIFLLHPDLTAFIEDHKTRATLLEGDTVIGPSMKKVRARVHEAARSNRPLLIQGETGTGKERIAKWFHSSGPRAHAPYVAVNCARFDRSRAEAELFGYARGAFTGAEAPFTGAFERADCGVLFLDEVAELAPDVQPKLLRTLEDGWIQPLSKKELRVDVAVVCATKENLFALVGAGRFREDLYERLRRRRVEVPPLRERLEEIPFLIERFRSQIEDAPAASARFVELCLRHPWPRNVRELLNVVDAAAGAAASEDANSLEPEYADIDELATETTTDEPANEADASALAMRDAKLLEAIARHGGNVAAACTEQGVARSTGYLALARERKRQKNRKR